MGNGKRSERVIFGLALGALCAVLLVSCPDFPEDVRINTNYAIKFDTHGGSEILPKYFVSGSEVYPHSFISDKNGYYFTGWFDAESGGTRFGGAGGAEKITVNRDLVFHAQWLVNRKISFNVGSGEPLPDLNIPNGGIFDPALYHAWYPGHGFGGWWNAASDGSQYINAFAVTGDLVLYARWEAGSHTVVFKTYGGTPVHAISVNHGEELYVAAYVSEWPDSNPQYASTYYPGSLPVHRDDESPFQFRGWYNAQEGGSKYPDTVTVNSDMTFHAQWW